MVPTIRAARTNYIAGEKVTIPPKDYPQVTLETEKLKHIIENWLIDPMLLQNNTLGCASNSNPVSLKSNGFKFKSNMIRFDSCQIE